MIRAIFLKDGFYITGHAGYAPSGSDIVCAAVSVLAQSAYLALRHYGVKTSGYQDDRRGVFFAAIPERDEEKRRIADIIVTQMRLGLKQIASQFPRYLRIISHQDGGGNNDV